MLRSVAPDDLAPFPGHVEHFGRHARCVVHRQGADVADALTDVELAVRLDGHQSVEADGARGEVGEGDTDARDLAAAPLAVPLLALFPVELRRALVEGFPHERAGQRWLLALRVRRAERGPSDRRVDLANLDLVDPELPGRLTDERLEHHVGLGAA